MNTHTFLIKVDTDRVETLQKSCAAAGIEFDPANDVFVLAQYNWDIEVFTVGDLEELAKQTNEHLAEDPLDADPRRIKESAADLSLEEKTHLLRFYQMDISFRHSMTTSVSGVPRDSLDALQDRAPGVFQQG